LHVGEVHAVEYDGDPTDVSRGFRIYETASRPEWPDREQRHHCGSSGADE
jgi:hypothetical protein